MKKIYWSAFLMLVLGASVGRLSAEDWADYRVYQWQETRARFGIGADYFNVGTHRDASPAVSLRYRISPEPWPKSEERPWHAGPIPLNVWLEAGSILPHSGSSLRIASQQVNASTTDRADVKLSWQAHLAVGSEFSLGAQRVLVPDAALGVAEASLKTYFDSQSRGSGMQGGFPVSFFDYIYGYENKTVWSPYIRFGLNFFPDHVVSFRISAAHVRYPYTFSHNFAYANTPANSHSQSFDFSLSGWQIMPMVEIKLLWPTAVHIPIVPQALPPWLLPSYTTEPVSPWVAPPEVAKDPRYNRPGLAAVGNVMFQYKNRWVDKVEIIGDFNDWVPERMMKDRSGIWVLVKDLPPGQFRYNYLLNDKKEILDPWNKDIDAESRSRGSSIVTIKEK